VFDLFRLAVVVVLTDCRHMSDHYRGVQDPDHAFEFGVARVLAGIVVTEGGATSRRVVVDICWVIALVF